MRQTIFGMALVGAISVATAHAGDPCGDGKLMASTKLRSETLYLEWIGRIRNQMAEKIETEFKKVKGQTKDVVLNLSSCGGDVRELERVAAVLRRIKETHRLATMVDRGAICGSACVPVFLQGQRRWAAFTSSWFFHETTSSTGEENSNVTVDRAKTEALFQDYYLAAGVSESWLNRLRVRIQHANYWQTGENLWSDKSGIITDPIDNLETRGTEEPRY
jgi:uncharacterized protein (UPF0335 family)